MVFTRFGSLFWKWSKLFTRLDGFSSRINNWSTFLSRSIVWVVFMINTGVSLRVSSSLLSSPDVWGRVVRAIVVFYLKRRELKVTTFCFGMRFRRTDPAIFTIHSIHLLVTCSESSPRQRFIIKVNLLCVLVYWFRQSRRALIWAEDKFSSENLENRSVGMFWRERDTFTVLHASL